MLAEGLEPNLISFNALLNAHSKCGDAKMCLRTLNRIRDESGLSPNVISYSCCLKACGLAVPKDEEAAEEVMRRMILESKIEPNAAVLKALERVLGAARRWELLEALGHSAPWYGRKR